MTRTYGHYCPVAHALEIVGDRWSLLIVRDLLRKPQRFSDLLCLSTGVTPKWLMLRLRKLEESGVIQKEKGQDRREVWYKLTSAGQDFRPVVEALGDWGFRYAMPPPLPEEEIHPELAMNTLATSLNKRDKRLARPTVWQFKFTPGDSYNISFNGDKWEAQGGKVNKPDVTITTSLRTWVTLLAVSANERNKLVKEIQIEGAPECIKEFLGMFRVKDTIIV